MNREDFLMLNRNIVYFDNGSTSLKPKYVVDSLIDYYAKHTSNVHRGSYDDIINNNELYESTRTTIKEFINCNSSREVVFTSGTTMSINMVVFGYMKKHLKKNDEILLTKSEHASNILPWIHLSEEIGTVIKYIPLDENHELTLTNVKRAITNKTKVISIAQVTNVIGDVRDIKSIGKVCKDNNILFCVDGAQSVPHLKVDFINSNIDFLSFSGHKMLGPTGVGVLVGKINLLKNMDAVFYGGGMNIYFEEDGNYKLKQVPFKFEAGTPPIAEVIGLKRAIEYLRNVGMSKIHQHEIELKKYLVKNLKKIDNIIMYNESSNSSILAFNLKGVFAEDTAIYLNKYKIYVRAGNHCAKELSDEIKIKNTVRISLYLYNNKKDIDKLIEVLGKSKDIFNVVI